MTRIFTALLILITAPALAAPRVATDIAPVHSLAAQVMDGIGAPDLILPPGASPHAYAMRPSEAAALQDADIVFWIGEALTPWFERNVEALAGDAIVVELLGAGGSVALPPRETAAFEAHHDDHEAHDQHGHDDDHGSADPHAWLDPDNAILWLDLMAATLADADPANASAYAANANAAKARIKARATTISAQLSPLHGARFIVFHDAYQYFERHFDIPAAGAIALSDARKPSPARIAEIRDHVREDQITCVFTEPQFNAEVVTAVFEESDVRTGVLDPMGTSLTPGPTFYGALLVDLADAMAGCLSD